MAVEKAPEAAEHWSEWKITRQGEVMDASMWLKKAEGSLKVSPRVESVVSEITSRRTGGSKSRPLELDFEGALQH